MPAPTTHGLWETSAPPAPATQVLDGEGRADVCIIGGGYTGISAALHLAQKGIQVLVLEAKTIGFGGAGRNVGLVNAGMWVMPDELPNVLGEVHGDRLLRMLGDAPALVFELVKTHGIDCQLETNGTLHCGVGQTGLDELKAREEQWQKRGAAVRLLQGDEAASMIGSKAYAGAPARHARRHHPAAGLCARSGPGLHLQPAQQFAQTPQQNRSKRSATAGASPPRAGKVTADWVIMATDRLCAGSVGNHPPRTGPPALFNFATEPLPDNVRATILPEKQGAWDTREVLSSFRMDAAGRLVFGSVGALKGAGEAIHRGWALRALRKIFPQIGDVRFEAEWYGQIGMTDDNLPRFHKFAEHVIGISGYNGRGIAPGTVMGRTLAELISGETREEDLPLPVTTPRDARLRVFKEAFYEVGAQAVHLTDARF
ncbi:MAG: FAD-binding oxidoreductase [Asticcacaulis sp.]